MKKITLVAMLIFCILSTGCGESWTAKSDDIISNYIKDEKGSQDRYSNQTEMKISGKVISKRQFDNSKNIAVTIAERQVEGNEYKIILAFEDVEMVNSISIGDFVVAEGTCLGLIPQETAEQKYIIMKVKDIEK